MIKNTDIAKELSLPPVKLHCSSTFFSLWNIFQELVNLKFELVLAEDAIKKAVSDWEAKKAARQQNQ
jgi:nitrogen fixation NifU-like protein